ncbi:MAG: DUF368 domain-containing protein [Bacilli bacterium]|nr:DUF368 domain-containing protein [Bacilli bacterium]
MKNIILVIKGFFVGIANIIPGVSGGTLMITLGIYESVIEAISHFTSNIKKHINLILWIGIGALLSIVSMSKVIVYSLDNYRLPTILFFIGLIVGGIPMLYGKVKGKINASNIIVFLITFLFVISMLFLNSGSNKVNLNNLNLGGYILLFIVGVIASATMVIPGISGSFVLMFLGYYEPILNKVNSLVKFNDVFTNLITLGVFGIGVLLGIIGVSKLIEFLLKNYEAKTFSGILGFVVASIISIIVNALNEGIKVTVMQVICAIVLFVIGFVIARKLGD